MMWGPASDYRVLGLVLAAGAVAGLARAYIAHRTRCHAEREASVRAAARATGLMGLAERHRGVVRIVERDRDGHREVEFGGREPAAGGNDEEAA
ncbi:hypothetical protein ADL15_24310 [Actinoplanes awajinensis subsp. mycoplanecinus]|uniref:Uncharacterized protein n=1 Tax=Actinoplanes awajinensis subsp. mycoplanecinus TaxID=135947 RepID=A0A101JQX2_9ACTN|nr:hypothetical protein ADL15_24310 [Actinoplanes awajinensis subsp. mycoplanecinus]